MVFGDVRLASRASEEGTSEAAPNPAKRHMLRLLDVREVNVV